jgi:hypothetical protein
MKMMILVLVTIPLIVLSATACSSSQVAGPTSEIRTGDQLVAALRSKSLEVSSLGETSPSNKRYFSVPSSDLRVEHDLVKVFEYRTPEAADADVRLVSADGQPNPRAQIGWISTPHFYKKGHIIVLHIGCTKAITEVLTDRLGRAIAEGQGCDNPITR